MKPVLTLSLLFALATPLAAQRSDAPFVVEESGESFYRLDEAVKSIGDGDATITIAPGSYKDCAIQTEGSITYRAARAGSVVFDGGICDGKAALVLDGRSAVVEGIIFQNMRVSDRNGSGIRLQQGDLRVVNALFRNSEQGILTHDDENSTLTIDRTTFTGLGGCPDGMCSHSIYVGKYGRVIVTNSRFDRGTGGHYVKSRAARNDISDNSFDDTQGRETNYMIDLPAGSTGNIVRNIFVQGRNKENYSAFIAVAAESRTHRSAGLVVSGNKASLAPGVNRNTTFVADWSHEPLRISANQLGAGLQTFETR
jgi:hypothetical protein